VIGSHRCVNLSYLGRGRMVVEEGQAPSPSAGCVRIKVDSAGVCKSDVYGYGQVNDRRDVVLGEGQTPVMAMSPRARSINSGPASPVRPSGPRWPSPR
jgi:Zn-dependent alcohol dehydrogenase